MSERHYTAVCGRNPVSMDPPDAHPIPDECCGAPTEPGFGFMGGGYGPYAKCLRCDTTWKTFMGDGDEPIGSASWKSEWVESHTADGRESGE